MEPPVVSPGRKRRRLAAFGTMTALVVSHSAEYYLAPPMATVQFPISDDQIVLMMENSEQCTV